MREHLGQTLHAIMQVLESAKGSEERMLRVMVLLRRIVPHEQCALFVAPRGREPRLLTLPSTSPDVRAALMETLVELHGQLVDVRVRPLESRPRRWGAHLAVPLIGNDEAIGVLLVRCAPFEGSAALYTEQHLRELSIVGSQLAAYLVMVGQALALDEARRDAETANRMKDEFLALVSHELKTPLTSMLAWARMLHSHESGSRAMAVAAIERNVEAQTKLVDEILDLACVANANMRLDLEAVDAANLVRTAVEQQRLLAEQRSIRLETNLDESVDPLVVDPTRVVQVISSLLGDAIQNSQSGGRVGIRLERAGVHARIQVIDHVKGISPEAKLGAGLAVMKTVVDTHGGQFRAESSGEGNGTTFTIELPLPVEARQDGQRLLAEIRVLLVDDDDDMRLAVMAVLEQYGAEVTAVASVTDALVALESWRPHVLLSDISMPGEGGYDLIREVASRDATLPAAALTSFARHEDRKRALAAGFQMHLAKPFDALRLVTAVATLTGRSQAKRSLALT
jgi:signal transduction histidine kinase/ActR/RegA family two-component response regulator